MRLIATHVDDTFALLRSKLEQEKAKPHRAIDPYFYRSHLVHEQELEHLIFKSWIYALHASEIPQSGDYQLLEIGEDNIIIVRGEDGNILRNAQHLQASRRTGLRGQVGQPEDVCVPLPWLGL